MDRFILIKKRTKRSLAGKVSYDETCTPGFESSTQGFIPGLVLFFQLLAKKAQCAPSQLVSVTHKKASNLFVPPSCLGRRHFYLKLVQAGVIQKLFRQYCQLMHQYFRGFKLCTPIYIDHLLQAYLLYLSWSGSQGLHACTTHREIRSIIPW